MKYIILTPELMRKIRRCGMEVNGVKKDSELKFKLEGYEECRRDILKILKREAMFWDIEKK